jgi:hypothetical protein
MVEIAMLDRVVKFRMGLFEAWRQKGLWEAHARMLDGQLWLSRHPRNVRQTGEEECGVVGPHVANQHEASGGRYAVVAGRWA